MYYEKVRDLVESGELNLLLTIAPPRTSSTLLESSLALSPSVSSKVNEPFMRPGQDNLGSDLGYKSILDSISNSGNTRNTVVVKEMPYWVNNEKEYERLFSLISEPVVILIRNPLLSMESRINKTLQSISIKARTTTQNYILNIIAKDLGVEEEIQQDSFVNPKIIQFIKDMGIEIEEPVSANQPNKELQEHLLDYYAQKIGFLNWEALRQESVGLHDYTRLGEVLNLARQKFTTEASDWKFLADEVNYLETHRQPFFIVDSTELRLCPEGVMQKMCARLNIEYSSNMVNWREDLHLDDDQIKPQNIIWHENLANSRGINPPTEIPPRLSDFPVTARECLRNLDLPAYISLSENPNRLKVNEGVFEARFSIKLSARLQEKYLSEGLQLMPAQTSSTEMIVRIQDIDPVFSAAYDKAFLQNNQYMKKVLFYKEELSEIIYLTEKEGKNISEGDFPGRRK